MIPRKLLRDACFALLVGCGILILLAACKESEEDPPPAPAPHWPSRYDVIPACAVKQTPAMDLFPPVVHSTEWEQPVPLAGPINTAGAEDAPVVTPDGRTFFFFFTPDVKVPPERQLFDSVTGIWWSRKTDQQWSEPERILLHNDLALDGPFCVNADTLWFGSFRAGNYLNDGDIFLAQLAGGRWTNWRNAGEVLNRDYNIGELYLTGGGDTMIFGRPDTLGLGGYDLWQTVRIGGSWSAPSNLGAPVNSRSDESHPYLSPDGNELWFNAPSRRGFTGPALYRTLRTDSGWTPPEEIVSNFAGDPGLDQNGNIYFTHHFFDDSLRMIEADIYVAHRRH